VIEPLPLGQVADDILNLLLQCTELVNIARLGEFGQCLHVDQADLGRLSCFAELLQQLVDPL